MAWKRSGVRIPIAPHVKDRISASSSRRRRGKRHCTHDLRGIVSNSRLCSLPPIWGLNPASLGVESGEHALVLHGRLTVEINPPARQAHALDARIGSILSSTPASGSTESSLSPTPSLRCPALTRRSRPEGARRSQGHRVRRRPGSPVQCPSLSSIAPGHDWIIITALDMLIARISGSPEGTAPFRRVPRESTRCTAG